MGMTKEAALALAERMISAAGSRKYTEFQLGYFDGLVGAWCQSGLISTQEMQTLRRRVRESVPVARPAWWDIATRIGL
jgi:hypothetical protein